MCPVEGASVWHLSNLTRSVREREMSTCVRDKCEASPLSNPRIASVSRSRVRGVEFHSLRPRDGTLDETDDIVGRAVVLSELHDQGFVALSRTHLTRMLRRDPERNRRDNNPSARE